MNRLLIGVLFVLLTALPASGGKGGIQVSPVTIDCGNENKEVNELESGSTARIWLNVPAGTNTDGISYTISDQTKPIVNATTFTVAGCGDGYFFGDITLPTVQGTVTLTVIQADGTNIGSDSFTLRSAA